MHVRIRLFMMAFLLLPAVGFAQYRAPPLAARQLAVSDPKFDDGIEYQDKHGGNAAIQKWVIEEATKGRLLAQLYLGERYIPQECRHMKDATIRLGECVADADGSGIELKPSFEQAFYWLGKASAQGSGEATEILAQQKERLILEKRPNGGTEDEVKQLHALARKQGYDEEKISVSCSVVHKSAAPLHLSGKRGPYDLPESQIVKARTVMPRGEIGDVKEGSATSEWMQHPEGATAKVWVVLDHPVTNDVAIPMPLHVEILVVQRGDGMVMVPPDAPHNARTITLHRKDDGSVKAMVQQADGGVSRVDCANF